MKQINARLKRVLLSTILPLSFIFTYTANAQMVGTHCFLQGDYTEVGVGACGAYGVPTGTSAPGSGPIGAYHPRAAFGGSIGFVCDSDADGWGTGSPGYCGDYFLPGSPFEGWGINYKIGATRYNLVNADRCGTATIPGSIDASSYSAVAGAWRRVTWNGSYSSGGIAFDVRIVTKFPQGANWFVGEVTILNTGSSTIEDLYWARFVDPDNEQSISGCGSFTTINKIESQASATTCESLVSAIGITCGCYLGMGSRDLRSKVSYSSPWSRNAYDIWNGLSGNVTTVSATTTADWATGVSFQLGDLTPGQQTVCAYAYVMDPDSINSALSATNLYGIDLLADSQSIIDYLVDTVCIDKNERSYIVSDTLGYKWTWVPHPDIVSTSGDAFKGDTFALVRPTKTTKFQVYATGGLCDSIMLEFTLVVDTIPVFIHTGPDLFICEGEDSIQLISIDYGRPESYWWEELGNPGTPAPFLEDPWSPTTMALPRRPITYVLNVEDWRGCRGADTIFVDVRPQPTPDAGNNQLVFEGTSVNMNGNPSTGTSWYWTPSIYLDDTTSLNPVATPLETTWYKLCVEDDYGCAGCDSVLMTVTREPLVYFPNAFTPNEDGLNDVFRPWVLGDVTDIVFKVYNRYGEEIYASSSAVEGWDGTYKGSKSDVGNYVFIFEGTDTEDGIVIRRKGVVTLVR